MLPLDFHVPGVLNSKEMLVAEAIHARAWETVRGDPHLAGDEAEAAKARLGGIVARLMSDPSRSVGDLAAAAVRAFNESVRTP